MGLLSFTAAAFARMQKELLPPGKLWKLLDSLLEGVFLGAADELVRVRDRAADLIEESDPRTATELLPDYERVLELASTGTNAERRNRIVSKYLLRQRVRPQDYKDALAPILGLSAAQVVVIEHSRAFAISVSDDRTIYRYYIFRDPALGGSWDVAGAQALVTAIEHSHTKGKVIESRTFKCNNQYSLCDRDLLGS